MEQNNASIKSLNEGDLELTNYDSIVNNYLTYAEDKCSYNNLYERPYLLSKLTDLSNKDVVDLGCGTGYFSKYAYSKGARVIAVDLSEEMLKHSKNSMSYENITFHKADLKDGLPFVNSNSQDYIICSLCIHYVRDWTLLLKDCFRVLKPSGRIYITTHHPISDQEALKKEDYFQEELASEEWGNPGNTFRVHFYTKTFSSLMSQLLQSDLDLIAIEEPLPTEQCKIDSPKLYHWLSKNPSLLGITLEKPASRNKQI
jgi:SAM-dependent methyltransferase